MAYEINININSEELEDAGQIKGVSKSSGTSKDEGDKNAKRLSRYIASQTIQTFIQNVKSAVSQDVGLVTGNTELQERINFGFQTVQFGVNTYKNIQAGALMGAQTGMGGGVGAALAVALTVLNTAIDFAFKDFQLNLRRNLEGYQLQQTRTRAGVAFNKSRRE